MAATTQVRLLVWTPFLYVSSPPFLSSTLLQLPLPPLSLSVFKTVCPSGLRGWTQVPLAQAAWVQIPQLSSFRFPVQGRCDPSFASPQLLRRASLMLRDSLAEWSKALASGASPQGRGFEPHSCHQYLCARWQCTVPPFSACPASFRCSPSRQQ